jgi:hypothetical protein
MADVDIFLSIVDVLLETFGGVLTWMVIALLSALVHLWRRFKQLRQDVDDLDRYITGDPDQPDQPGLLQSVQDIDDEVCGLRADMETQHRQMEDHHRETDRKLERLLNNNSNE